MKAITYRLQQSHANLPYMLAVAIGQSLWGVSYLFTRIALQSTNAQILLSMRFVLAFLLINLPVFMGKVHVSFKGKHKKAILIFAIAQPLYYYLESQGILYTNSAFAGVFLSMTPIASIVLARIIMKERPASTQVALCFLPIIGVIMITLSNSSIGAIQPIGVIFLFLTCLAAAILTIYNKKTSDEYSPFERTYVTMLSGSITYTALAMHSVHFNIQEYLQPLSSTSYITSLLSLVLLCSIIANTMVNAGANQLSVAKFSIFFSFSTIVSMLAGVLVLHEPMTIVSIIGSLLIIIGVWKVNAYKT